jgi:hypothetical protein
MQRSLCGSAAYRDCQEPWLTIVLHQLRAVAMVCGEYKSLSKSPSPRRLKSGEFSATYFADFGRPVRPGLPYSSSIACRTHSRGTELFGSAAFAASSNSPSVARPCSLTTALTSP